MTKPENIYSYLHSLLPLAYAPYSKFRVAALVETESGHWFSGCNIENASFSLTCCAERVAIFNALSQGHQQIKSVHLLADKPFTPPCGACRQVMMEFGSNETQVVLYADGGEKKVFSLGALLPGSFTSATLTGDFS